MTTAMIMALTAADSMTWLASISCWPGCCGAWSAGLGDLARCSKDRAAARDVVALGGHETRVVGAEEGDHGGDFLRLAGPAHRDPRNRRLAMGRRDVARLGHR